jgi:L-ribulose-5-phosphate 4-epimerase
MPTEQEAAGDYEANVGRIIVERFEGLSPEEIPGVLVAGHGPFTWGRDAASAVEHAVVLEEIAKTTLGALRLNPAVGPIPAYLIDRHYGRKHGARAYYGQRT